MRFPNLISSLDISYAALQQLHKPVMIGETFAHAGLSYRIRGVFENSARTGVRLYLDRYLMVSEVEGRRLAIALARELDRGADE